jgi:hypothetical protein
MQSCHKPPQDARPFVTAPYSLLESDQPLPQVLPESCLFASSESGACRIRRAHLRERKTGPCFPVVVLRCHTHRHAFTLYPLGHMPYGRVAFAPVSSDGELLTSADEEGGSRGGPSWQTTIFLAALQAASGHPWPREADGSGMIWETQLEHLEKSAKLLGLTEETPPRTGEQIASRLCVRRLELLDAAQAYQGARGYMERGRAIVSVLKRLEPLRCFLQELLLCGVLSGLWGRVERWDPGGAGARRTVFSAPGTLGT